MKSEFKDLFSSQSSEYKKFRPNYPSELYNYLSGLSRERSEAWDCGTGNGQAAVELANFFNIVRATDPSASQLENAVVKPNIFYTRATAENSGLHPKSVDLTTVAQAFHWFNHARFAEEVSRVSKSGAHLAVWGYNLARLLPEIDEIILYLYRDILENYWEKERRHIEEGFQNIEIPFVELKSQPEFKMTAEWSFDHLIGYLGTWSSTQAYIKKNGTNPVELVFERLQKAWNKKSETPKTLKVEWDLALRVWKI